VRLLPLTDPDRSRGLTLDKLVWTEQAKRHPRRQQAEEAFHHCLLAASRDVPVQSA
jgi:hypothetical protein